MEIATTEHPGIHPIGCRLAKGGRPWWCRGICYGPFPTTAELGWLPDPDRMARDIDRMAGLGFNTIRVFHPPGIDMLRLAADRDMAVLAGFPWGWNTDFLADPATMDDARAALAAAVTQTAGHPALAGWIIANEIDATMVRWLGHARVRAAMESLCTVVHRADPGALALYANFPPTEWLAPDNADVIGMNIYLEDDQALRRYLRRAHHLTGGRPLLITEFGIDRKHHGPDVQADWVHRAFAAAHDEGASGLCWFTWSDDWRDARTGMAVQGWQFGLTGMTEDAYPALAAVAPALAACTGHPVAESWPRVSVLVCTRNGRGILPRCLHAVAALDYPDVECIVVDDGSDDGTAGWVAATHPDVKILATAAGGLGRARNSAAAAATGGILAFLDDDCEPEPLWLRWAVAAMQRHDWNLAGGPNLAPSGGTPMQQVLDRLPGLATHVLLDDENAEHLPGCNLLVRADTFHAIGGFDTIFHTAGDDVDFCWRALGAGCRIGFVPLAVVHHHRRSSPWKSLKQQFGYGRAETMLASLWAKRVGPGGARWAGVIYGAARSLARVYRGPFGYGDYPTLEMTFATPRPPVLATAPYRAAHRILSTLQPWARALGRWWQGMNDPGWPERRALPPTTVHPPRDGALWHPTGMDRDHLLADLATALGHAGLDVRADDGWQEVDLHITDPAIRTTCSLVTVTEYTDQPGRLTRWRITGPVAQADRIERVLDSTATALGFTRISPSR